MHFKKDINRLFFIEGNVGVGKSTFLTALSEQVGNSVVYEPVELWENVEGFDLLQYFFLDHASWAYVMQNYVLLTRLDQLDQIVSSQGSQPYLIERSVYSGRYCFASIAYQLGWMNDIQFAVYNTIWQAQTSKRSIVPAGFIYLRSSAQVCYDRIIKRNRQQESTITLDYLKRIEQKHDRWLLEKEGVDQSIVDVPVLVLDFSIDLQSNPEIYQKYLQQVLNFIAK